MTYDSVVISFYNFGASFVAWQHTRA